jgi:nitric oxide dioxygenase
MLKTISEQPIVPPVYFVHASRNSQQHAMAEEVRHAANRHQSIRTHFRYDAPLSDDLSSGRCDSAGLVDRQFLEQWLPDNNAEFYFCGPRPFMANVYRALKDMEVDDSQIHFEFFGPRQEISSHV